MVSLSDNHLIRFLVSDYGISWTEMHEDRELIKLEGAEAIAQLQDLADLVKYRISKTREDAKIMVPFLNRRQKRSGIVPSVPVRG